MAETVFSRGMMSRGSHVIAKHLHSADSKRALFSC